MHQSSVMKVGLEAW